MKLRIFLCIIQLAPSLCYSQESGPFEAGWEGKKMCEIAHEDETNRVLICTFPPGTGHERHGHGPTYNYFLQGGTLVIEDETGKQEVTIETGLNYFSDAVSWHEAVNIGSTTVRALLVERKQ